MEKDIMNNLFSELVPSMGKADTVAGELVRATSRLRYRFYNDGDKPLSGYGNETCNGSLRYITSTLASLSGTEEILDEFNTLWDGDLMSDNDYEYQLEICVEKMVAFIEENNDLIIMSNYDDSISDFIETEDYDYDEDEDDDVDEYDIYDEYDYDDEYDGEEDYDEDMEFYY